MFFDKRVTHLSEASEGGEHQWRSFEEDCGTQQERTTVILRYMLEQEENFVAGA